MSSISAIIIPHLARTLRSLDADVEAILGEHVSRLDVQFEDRVPVGSFIEIWERAVAATGCRDLPARTVAYSLHDEHWNVVPVIVPLVECAPERTSAA